MKKVTKGVEKESNNCPQIIMSTLDLSENSYVSSNGDTWNAATLIQWCKDKNYQVFDMPVACCNVRIMPWRMNTLDDFIWHMNRVNNTNLDYPIILDDYGEIADGYHRVCKAILEGRKYIKAIRIINMPAPDGHKEE